MLLIASLLVILVISRDQQGVLFVNKSNHNSFKTLRVGVVSLPPALGNPYRGTGIPTIYTHRAMFEGLTFVTADGNVEPLLATEWERSGELTWQFKLRRNVRFHNGKLFNAESVLSAIEYLTSSEASIEPVARDLAALESAKAIDEYTVEIKTSVPSPLLPALMEALLIVEPNHWKNLGRDDFALNPLGTGPFKLINWEDSKANLVAYDRGWRVPKVDFLEIYEIPDASSRVQAILSDKIDIAVGLSRDDIMLLEQSGARGDVGKTISVLGISFILTRLAEDHPLQDIRIRQALNYAVNKEDYIEALFGNLTQASSQPTTASGFGYNGDLMPYDYNPDLARQLLDEAGYSDGFSFKAQVTIGAGASASASYQYVANNLRDIGVEMILQTLPVQQLTRGVLEGEWQGDAFGMNFSAQRTLDALRPLRLHSCLHPHPWFCDRGLTEKIETAFSESNISKRRYLTQQIMKNYRNTAPAIWLHEVVMFKGLGPRVRNFRQDLTVINYHAIDLVQ